MTRFIESRRAGRCDGATNQLERHVVAILIRLNEALNCQVASARQFIACIVADPKIIIMDAEPVEAAGERGRAAPGCQLKDWVKDRTLVVITHRAPMLALVEHLMVLVTKKSTPVQRR